MSSRLTGLIEVTLRQQVGRVGTVAGSGLADIACEPGETGTLSAQVVPLHEFRGGQPFASARLVLDGVTEAEIPAASPKRTWCAD